jgi:c-di-GMP-binding flagellar brake protein YcgR
MPGGATSAFKNRRFGTRVPVQLRSHCERLSSGGFVDATFTAGVHDVSAGGALLAVTDPLPVGQRLRIALTSGEPWLNVRVVAEVVRFERRMGASRVGVRFEGLSADDRAALVRFVLLQAQRMRLLPASA